MHILILDMVHGGDFLAEDLIAQGNEITAVDVYGIASEEKKQHLRDIGARVERNTPDGHYDLLLSPSHCPDELIGNATYSERKTFHQAVGELTNDNRFRIEITGVKGKTSTCYLLAHVLGETDKKVFLHTSRGQGPWINGEHKIEKLMSIAPTSMIRLPEGDFDVIVSEISLGGTGKADIALITNLVEDYGIARNSRKASDSKATILCNNVNIVPLDEVEIWSKYGNFPLKGYGNKVKILSKPELGKPLDIEIDYKGKTQRVSLNGSYLSLQYISSIERVLAVCEEMDISLESIVKGLESFKGVPGRGEIFSTENGWKIVERNPGISHMSIDMSLSCLKDLNALESAFIIVDPVSKRVCDKMDKEKIEVVAEKYGARIAFTDGCGSYPDVPKDAITVVEFIKEGFQ